MKSKLKKLKIRENEHTVVTMDIESMYPSIKFRQIVKAVDHFLRDASESDKKQAKLCLELGRFGMANTFVQFEDEYWLYGGDMPVV